MILKINHPIKKADGTGPIINTDTDSPLTLKDCCINALLTPEEQDPSRPEPKGEVIQQKITDYRIYEKFRDAHAGKDVELTTEEIVRIKARIGAVYPPLILGQCYDWLEAGIPSPAKSDIKRRVRKDK